uniref:DUF4283 domain-containing protein n=1 Tax=Populus alba TaxID=43335 RepID=A0A4U5QJQ0_POPAL|nr:hypothetical protein D5086_0000078350 [Populus alba]
MGKYKDWWRFSLIGFIAGKFPGYTSISTFANTSWKCTVNFSMHDSGWLIFTFDSEPDMLEVLNGGPYYVHGRPMISKIMPEFFDFDTSDMFRMPVWIRFPNLPLKCWSPICLSKLASVIGKPLQLDTPTSSITRLSYARVLVETDLLAKLPKSINISLPNRVNMAQKVLYESLLRFCKKCRSLGHNTSSCVKNSAVEKQPPQEVPQGVSGFDPMSTEAAVAGEERADNSTHKRVKLTTPINPTQDPGSPLIVPMSEDDVHVEPLLPKRQYLTRSKAAATYGRSDKIP